MVESQVESSPGKLPCFGSWEFSEQFGSDESGSFQEAALSRLCSYFVLVVIRVDIILQTPLPLSLHPENTSVAYGVPVLAVDCVLWHYSPTYLLR